jgi:CheY-like chemotaxis protein
MNSGRFILRAELRSAAKTVVSYGYDLSEGAIFVVTDWQPPPGTAVALRLSFPRSVPPIEIMATVDDRREAGAPGEFAGVRLVWDPASESGAAVRALLDRVSKPAQPPGDQPAFRLLLVEDNGLIRDVFAHGLANFFKRPSAFVVEHADSAEAAWKMLATHDYDLVIVDYFLPAANGASLIADLRGDPRLAKLPVVAISVGGRDAREATIAAGADLFVDKPLVFRDLFSTLRVLWERRGPSDKKSILVLDDSPLALEVSRMALESAGFDVTIAADLAAFERERASHEPDLILVDVQMPEAYGDDVASMLVARADVRAPIVLLSSIEEDELARRAGAAQVAGYICKAAGTTELVRRCKELLGAPS